jgi:[ribosomal protein S18]-alanine N-acetyltransferase
MDQDDIDAVMLLERATFTMPWDERLFRKIIRRRDDSIFLVARVDRLLVGYSGASLIGNEVHVTNMAVGQSWRGRGIATAMLMRCVEISLARGARWMTLEVRESNSEAREFYCKFGFGDLGLRMGYYEDTGEHAVIMATGDITTDQYTATLHEIKRSLDNRGVSYA